MKKVEISVYEIKGGRIIPLEDSSWMDFREAFGWMIRKMKEHATANYIKIFTDKNHENHYIFDKNEKGEWIGSSI